MTIKQSYGAPFFVEPGLVNTMYVSRYDIDSEIFQDGFIRQSAHMVSTTK